VERLVELGEKYAALWRELESVRAEIKLCVTNGAAGDPEVRPTSARARKSAQPRTKVVPPIGTFAPWVLHIDSYSRCVRGAGTLAAEDGDSEERGGGGGPPARTPARAGVTPLWVAARDGMSGTLASPDRRRNFLAPVSPLSQYRPSRPRGKFARQRPKWRGSQGNRRERSESPPKQTGPVNGPNAPRLMFSAINCRIGRTGRGRTTEAYRHPTPCGSSL
jgi:hypothetical protein